MFDGAKDTFSLFLCYIEPAYVSQLSFIPITWYTMRLFMTPLWCQVLGLGLLPICIPFVVASPHDHIAAHQRAHHHRDALSSTTLLEAATTVATPHTNMLLADTATMSVPTGFFNISDLTMFSSDCAAALASTVDCSDIIRDSDFQSGLSAENITALCTIACFDSITSFRSKVLTSCANDVYTDEPVNGTSYVYGTGVKDDIYNIEGISIKPIGLVDPFFVNYNVTCMQDECVGCLQLQDISLLMNIQRQPSCILLPFACERHHR